MAVTFEPGQPAGMTYHPFTYVDPGGREFDGTLTAMTSDVGGQAVDCGTEITWCEEQPGDTEAAEAEVEAAFSERN